MKNSLSIAHLSTYTFNSLTLKLPFLTVLFVDIPTSLVKNLLKIKNIQNQNKNKGKVNAKTINV